MKALTNLPIAFTLLVLSLTTATEARADWEEVIASEAAQELTAQEALAQESTVNKTTQVATAQTETTQAISSQTSTAQAAGLATESPQANTTNTALQKSASAVGAGPYPARAPHGVAPTVRISAQSGTRTETAQATSIQEAATQNATTQAATAQQVAVSAPASTSLEPRIFPPAADSAYYLAGQYVISGRYQDAISYFDQAIKLASTGAAHFRIADAFYSKGNAHVYLGHPDAAICDYSKAISLDANYALAYYMRGQIYQGRSEFQKAIPDFKKAIEINSTFALAFGGLAMAYHGIGENERAVEYCSNSISLDAKSPWFYDVRAQAYRDLGNYEKYAEDLSQEIQLLSQQPNTQGSGNPRVLLAPAYYNRAQAYQKLGKNDLAQRDLDKAKELGYSSDSKKTGSS